MHSLQACEVGKDGNCLFHSLAKCMEDIQIDHHRVRELLIDYIQENAERFEGDILASNYLSVSDYCESMARDGEWGDAIMLQAFILMTNVNVRLFTDYGFSDLNPGGHQNVALIQHRGHYQPAIPINPPH